MQCFNLSYFRKIVDHILRDKTHVGLLGNKDEFEYSHEILLLNEFFQDTFWNVQKQIWNWL